MSRVELKKRLTLEEGSRELINGILVQFVDFDSERDYDAFNRPAQAIQHKKSN
jgi:hypothetical protein